MNKTRLLAFLVLLVPTAAFAHPGHDVTGGFATGLQHPLTGLDHVAAMIAVGLWAGLKGGRALWAWPAAFVGVMLIGGMLGMEQIPLPLVEPGILASVVVLGLLVAMAVDLPVGLGAAIVGVFALFHGYAHGSEASEAADGVSYLAGFAIATTALHELGIAVALLLRSPRRQPLVRFTGVACMLVGIGLAIKAI